jgi:hypothetical protein
MKTAGTVLALILLVAAGAAFADDGGSPGPHTVVRPADDGGATGGPPSKSVKPADDGGATGGPPSSSAARLPLTRVVPANIARPVHRR